MSITDYRLNTASFPADYADILTETLGIQSGNFLSVKDALYHFRHLDDGQAAEVMQHIANWLEAGDFEPEREPKAAAKLLASLQAVLPYAQAEGDSLSECSRRDDDTAILVEALACERAIEAAQAVIADANADGIFPAPDAISDQHPRFEIEHNPKENPDRVYVLVDGKFGVAIIRTDEGVVVDVYPKDGVETIATAYAFNADAETDEAGEA